MRIISDDFQVVYFSNLNVAQRYYKSSDNSVLNWYYNKYVYSQENAEIQRLYNIQGNTKTHNKYIQKHETLEKILRLLKS